MEQENALDLCRLLVSAASGTTNAFFYVMLMCCWHLSTTLHWAICNVAVSELTRAIVGILSVAVRRKMIATWMAMFGRVPPRDIIGFNQPYHTAKRCLEVAEMCTTIITVIFGLLAIAQMHNALGAIDGHPPRFGHNIAILSALIWVAGVSYFVMQMYLIMQSSDVKVDMYAHMIRYFTVADLVMIFVWLFGAAVLAVLCVRRIIKGSARSADPYRAAVVLLCDQPDTIKARNRRWQLRSFGLLAVLVGFTCVVSLLAAENIVDIVFHFNLGLFDFLAYAKISKRIQLARSFTLGILTTVLPFVWMLLDRQMHAIFATGWKRFRRLFDRKNEHRLDFYPHIQSHIIDNEKKSAEQKQYFKDTE